MSRFSRELSLAVPLLGKMVDEQRNILLATPMLSCVENLDTRKPVLDLLDQVAAKVAKTKTDAKRFQRYQQVLQVYSDVESYEAMFVFVFVVRRGRGAAPAHHSYHVTQTLSDLNSSFPYCRKIFSVQRRQRTMSSVPVCLRMKTLRPLQKSSQVQVHEFEEVEELGIFSQFFGLFETAILAGGG